MNSPSILPERPQQPAAPSVMHRPTFVLGLWATSSLLLLSSEVQGMVPPEELPSSITEAPAAAASTAGALLLRNALGRRIQNKRAQVEGTCAAGQNCPVLRNLSKVIL